MLNLLEIDFRGSSNADRDSVHATRGGSGRSVYKQIAGPKRCERNGLIRPFEEGVIVQTEISSSLRLGKLRHLLDLQVIATLLLNIPSRCFAANATSPNF